MQLFCVGRVTFIKIRARARVKLVGHADFEKTFSAFEFQVSTYRHLFCLYSLTTLSFVSNAKTRTIDLSSRFCQIMVREVVNPVLKINDHATGGRRTKDILGGPKSLETKKLGSSKG